MPGGCTYIELLSALQRKGVPLVDVEATSVLRRCYDVVTTPHFLCNHGKTLSQQWMTGFFSCFGQMDWMDACRIARFHTRMGLRPPAPCKRPQAPLSHAASPPHDARQAYTLLSILARTWRGGSKPAMNLWSTCLTLSRFGQMDWGLPSSHCEAVDIQMLACGTTEKA